MTKNKKEILEEIKKLYRIKPITAVMVLMVITFIFMTIIGAVNEFGRKLTSDFFSALLSLFFAWNLGFGLYQGIWQFSNSRKINKVLFPKLEQFINESEEKSYDETETEAYEKVKVAYAAYTEKYNKLNKIYWTSIKISIAFLLITLVISFVYYQL
jgi:ABC-type spermidine/putrescine transport system permease subunit I